MDYLKSICRALKLFLAVCWCSAALHATALAQAAKEEAGDKKGSWVFSYALVLLGIGLGMLVVLRSSRRRERAKPQQYAEGNGAGQNEAS